MRAPVRIWSVHTFTLDCAKARSTTRRLGPFRILSHNKYILYLGRLLPTEVRLLTNKRGAKYRVTALYHGFIID